MCEKTLDMLWNKPTIEQFSAHLIFEFYVEDLVKLNINNQLHGILFRTEYAPSPVYICAIVYVCRLIKLKHRITKTVAETCLQLSCKYLEV